MLRKSSIDKEAIEWINHEYYPSSEGVKNEIYLRDGIRTIDSMINLFFHLFGEHLGKLTIGQYSLEAEWGHFCLDTWDFENDIPNYNLENKSHESLNYLNLLLDSKIEFGYTGFCHCDDWDPFLRIILKCIVTHSAPYSPLFYNDQDGYFFYFHHTYSLGFYYKRQNKTVSEILEKMRNNNQVVIE
jgi:hypothetical protein